jgi:uncharacterized protein (DUF2141 family)
VRLGLVAGGLLMVAALSARAAEVTVTVAGVRSADGVVRACLWNKPDGFPNCSVQSPAIRQTVKAHPGRVVVAFGDVAPGVYAVSVFHDEKNTGKVETNLLGIPRSGLGASNDARGRFGPPSFKDAAFTVGAAPVGLTLNLLYP